ncbi:hypothetical protein V6N12_073116 [Hibiscus sabdariffa]|uniref:Uncharacterized protein n=1 Tax=Hibiscus sabdariffa TaxID=183260 RepID=A0ABR2A894_9ROSI
MSINDGHCEALGEVERALGEDECESLSDRELNCDEVERVFFSEIVSKKSTKKSFGAFGKVVVRLGSGFPNEILTKKAKEALALGKYLGVEIEGNEEGALKELVRLESQN